MSTSRYQEIKEACCEGNQCLAAMGIVDLTFGNLSVRHDKEPIFAIKPSGVNYDVLRADACVVVDFDGEIVEGKLNPSSDTPTHQCLYRQFDSIRSVVHTHSRHATAFAQAGRPIPCLGTTHCDYFRGEIPVTRPLTHEQISGSYEWETGVAICNCFHETDPMEIPAALVRWHAPFVWGTGWETALETAFALEIIAEMTAQALGINPDAEPVPIHLRDRHFLRKHGKSAYYGQKQNTRSMTCAALNKAR